MICKRFTCFLISIFGILLLPYQAQAEVTLTFYSHNFGSNYPHAFVEIKGNLETGEIIEEDLGFTPAFVGPNVLLGSVKGIIKGVPKGYKENSDPHFAIVVSDETYHEIKSFTEDWLTSRKKSYNLNKRNCVHYIGAMLNLVDIKTNTESRYFKKPKSFLKETLSLNPKLLPSAPSVNAVMDKGKVTQEPISIAD